MSIAESIKWIVNDDGELGVKVDGKCYFLRNGVSYVYATGLHDDGQQRLIRPVEPLEFGLVCRPPQAGASVPYVAGRGWAPMPQESPAVNSSAASFIRLARIARLRAELSDLTHEEASITNPHTDINMLRLKCQVLKADGFEMHAIKLYRDKAGISLREAKDAVDGMASPTADQRSAAAAGSL